MSHSKGFGQKGELQRLRKQITDLTTALSALRIGVGDPQVHEAPGTLQLDGHTNDDSPYRLIVEWMEEGAVTLTPQGRILFANQHLAELLGRGRAELIGRAVTELVAAEGQDDLETLLAVGPGHKLRLPLKLQRPDGQVVPVQASMSGLVVQGEELRCLITTDLRGIQSAERALKESDLSFRMLALNARDGILIVDWESGQITLANPYLCQLLGRESHELISQPIWKIGIFRDQERAHELFLQMKTSRAIHDDDLTLLSSTGELKEVEFDSNVYVVGGGKVIQCNIHDISDRRAAERLAQQRQGEVMQSLQDMVSALMCLGESRDPYTAGHQSRVAHLAVAIGAELGLDADQLEGLRICCLVHDIGKFAIPVEILTKPSRLKPVEFDLLCTHVQEGYDVLAPIHFPWPVAEAVRQHHERLDGSGYPQGLRGDAIGLWGRILGVADTVEAMATHRPYRFSKGIDVALDTIEAGRRQLFDPAVVEACLVLFRERGYQLSTVPILDLFG